MTTSPSPCPSPVSSPSVDWRPGRNGRVERSGRLLLRRVVAGVDLAKRGRFERTVEILDDTHPRLRRHPLARESAPVLPGFLANLGLAHILRGGFGAARDHLEEARSLAADRRLHLLELVTRQNLGCLALRGGDSAGAVATFTDLAHRLPADRREALCTDLAEALLAEGHLEEAARTLADGPWAHGRSAQAATLLVEAKLRLLRGDRYRARELVRRVRGAYGAGSLWHGLAERVEAMADQVCAAPRVRAHAELELRRPLSVCRPLPPLVAAHRAVEARPEPWAAPRDPQVARAGLEAALARGDLAAALEWAERAVPAAPGAVGGPVVERYRAALAQGRDRHCLVYARRWERSRYARRLPEREHGPVGGRLAGLLEGRAFVRLAVAGEVVALVVAGGRVHALPLGAPAAVARDLAGALAPVLELAGERPLVIAADPRLGRPQWGTLPGLRDRPVAVVPSARAWADRVARPLPRWRRVLLVSGPGPRGAAREVADLAGIHARARTATRVGEAVSGAAGCDLVHLAGHGRVSERSPLLSSVALDDGPLLALDLVSAPPPEVVVLTSCGAGRFAGALLSAGVRAVVANPAPVLDSGTGRAVAGFHRALAAGAAPPEAVAAHLGRLGFVCLGA
ncbi:CHAT domain-containing protein [Nocardiopsis flavescens]|uniref:CHAT domain-containing protein n=1 Tax=Nocardiopsis flavescens TaxID=758803 RepID=A0A1M6MLB1_9ACTN|nr:CHAT domain-containing protein [Nocardiopsis flavescens]SHJ84261.1 CHAT domain-containing protein [Nocardiopsis flavescens]